MSERFAANIRNPNTRSAYGRAVGDFLTWGSNVGVVSIDQVQTLHVAAWVELRTRQHSAPTTKQDFAALRHLFDWPLVGEIVPANPAAAVRGPAYSVKVGKTPVLDAAEARTLLDSIDTATPIELRDRARISLEIYSFARVSAAVGMRVEDVYVQKHRL
jgi:site-specific recombinase XerD